MITSCIHFFVEPFIYGEALDAAEVRIRALKVMIRRFEFGEDPRGILQAIDDVVIGLRDVADALKDDKFPGQSILIIEPVGNCDGSGLYAYDRNADDGRGQKLKTRCAGCRACR